MTAEDRVRAILAGEFWIASHLVSYTTLTGPAPYNLRKFLTKQEYQIHRHYPLYNVFGDMGTDGAWQLDELVYVVPNDTRRVYTHTLRHTTNNGTEIWFGLDAMRTVANVPETVQHFLDATKD